MQLNFFALETGERHWISIPSKNSEDSHVFGCAELHGTFADGARRGQATHIVGKVVKIIAKR